MMDFILNLLKNAASYLAAFFAGELAAQKKEAERNAQAYQKLAEDLADQPLTDDDFEQRMRLRIAGKPEAKSIP